MPITREPADSPAPAQLPRGTVTFLFTDVEGSTVAWIRNPSAMRAALARHDELIESIVTQCSGVLVRPRGEGDSRFAVFPRATDAVVAASQMQIALCREVWPTEAPLRVRVALHTGEADVRAGDYYGPAVNHCARLRAIAHGGQVLISSVTANLVRESLVTGISLLDLGEHLLKDLEQPERIWQLSHPELPAEFPALASRERDRRGVELGKLVRRYRLATRLSQEDLAEKAGISVRGLSDLERGVRSAPHPDSIRRLANALGLQGDDRSALMSAITEPDRASTESSSPAILSSGKSRSFGPLLRQRRLTAGLSQDELAQRSGLSRRGLADLERGARNYPHGETVRRIAEALGLSPSDTAALIASGQRTEPSPSINRYLLPVEPVALIGRDHEISELQLIMKSARLVTLTGPGGIGKTRLALELARRVEASYDNGAVFVDLAPVGEPSGVVRVAAQALGVGEEPNRPLIEAVQDHLAIRQVLLILDNCEHVLDGSAQLADWLVRHCAEVRVVATSREPMRVAAEVAWPVPPLRLEHARELFVERAHAAHAALHLTDDDRSVVSEICQELEGLPLAIELAAARVPMLALPQIRDRLSQRLRLLSSGGRLTSARHQTLRAAIDWSDGLLLAPERQLFHQLAVFSGGWELSAAEQICATGTLTSFEILDLLTELVRKSLVIADLGADRSRYRLLETIREFASDRLEAAGHRSETRRRHLAYYRALAEPGAATRRGMRYAADMQLLLQEHNNYRAALSSALELGDLNEGLRLCCALGGFWLSQGFLVEAQSWFDAFLERADDLEWETVVDGLFYAGRVGEYSGAFDRSGGLHQRSLELAQRYRDVSRSARALYGLGDVALHRGEYDAAEAYLEQGLALGQGMGANSDLAEALLSLARIADARGEADSANDRLEESLRIQRALGDKWGIALALNLLGQRVRRRGELERAQSIHEESYELWRQSGTRMGQRAALMNLAVISLDRGHLNQATAFARATLEISREMTDGSATTVRCVEIAARTLQASGSSSVASSLLGAASSQRESLGAPVPQSEQAEYTTLVQAVRESLGEDRFRGGHAAGMQLAIDEAVDLVG